MRLSFRQRLFLGLVLLGAAPLAVAIIVLVMQASTSSSPAGPRAALEEIAESGRNLGTRLDTLALTPQGRIALQQHGDVIARGTTLARRAETLSRLSAAVLAVVVAISGVGLVAGSIFLAQRWSRSFSQPIENLIEWIRRIEKGEPLPTDSPDYGSPEVEALAGALKTMAAELESARHRELEQERLVAFREVARRVAHEIRGPLTASRLAIAQIERSDEPASSTEALRVLKDEADRLDDMAREFSEFSRLPEGPRAPIEIADLVDNVISAIVPHGVPAHTSLPSGLTVVGHYEPLRRAVQNLVRNAVEATDDRGIMIAASTNNEATSIEICVSDFGPGIPAAEQNKIFQPYVTTKAGGTGLGLAIVKQVAETHGGKVSVQSTGDGSAFTLHLPASLT